MLSKVLTLYLSNDNQQSAVITQVAIAPTLVAGTITNSTQSNSTVTNTFTAATGGFAASPTANMQRSPAPFNTGGVNYTSANFTPLNLIASPALDTGLAGTTLYRYNVAYNDGLSPTVYSNTINVTTATAVVNASGDNGRTPAQSFHPWKPW